MFCSSKGISTPPDQISCGHVLLPVLLLLLLLLLIIIIIDNTTRVSAEQLGQLDVASLADNGCKYHATGGL
jgi:uncharacterized membrane protein YqjE